MKNVLGVLSALCLVVGLTGCGSLDPKIIEALAKDDASICISTDVRGGVGAVPSMSGGYGQATTGLCRSKMPDAQIELKADGSISIKHGAGVQ